MAKKFLVNLDLNSNSLLNPVLNPLATAPTNAAPYYIYTSTAVTDAGVVYVNVGTYASPVWKPIGSVQSVNGQTGAVTTYKGAWTTATKYYVGDMVSNDGNLYICKTEHTSAASFADTNWQSASPVNHASSATTYGTGTDANYGHLKLSDSTSSASSTDGGTAATPAAVKAAYDLANDALPKSGGTMSGAIAMGSNKITGIADGTTATDAAAFGQIPTASTADPEMDGTASAGTSSAWAKGDHVHPTDTSRAPLASPAFTGTPTAPTAAAGTDNTQIATTEFVMDAIGGLAQAMVFKGVVNAASDIPANHTVGWTYIVGTAGTYVGETCEVGDLIVCVATGTTASNADWNVLQTNIDGAVTGPASSTSGHIPTFNGTSGKVIQDGYGVASSITDDSTSIPTTAAVYGAVSGLIKTATATISTSATSATVTYTSGTVINAYATMGGAEVVVDISYGSGTVTFTVASAPSSAVTCTVIYA